MLRAAAAAYAAACDVIVGGGACRASLLLKSCWALVLVLVLVLVPGPGLGLVPSGSSSKTAAQGKTEGRNLPYKRVEIKPTRGTSQWILTAPIQGNWG